MVKFSKFNGLGNDFIITDENIEQEQIQKLCDRHFGIGADGVIINSVKDNMPFMKFFNADGSVAKMCGNGIRCYAKYLDLKGEDFTNINTLAGIKNISKVDDKYRVCLGKATIKFLDKQIIVNNKKINIDFVDTGTDHCTIIDSSIDFEFLEKYGVQIEKNYEIFPNGTNVNLVHVISDKEINVHTFERGVGITLACGTGASASVVIAHKKGLVSNNCKVNLLGGSLNIDIENENVYMTGTATKVFDGLICDEIFNLVK